MKSRMLALSRRRALRNGTAAVIVGSAGLPSWPAWSNRSPLAETSVGNAVRSEATVLRRAVEQLAMAFRGPEPAGVLGRASLNTAAIPVDPDVLFETLVTRHPQLADVLASDDPAAIRRSVDIAARRDFAAGNSLVVRGWLLARSEAEICSLICLA